MPGATAPAKAPEGPKTTAVRAPDGSIYEVPSGEVSQMPEGSEIAGAAEVHQARAEEKYSGPGSALAAGALGAASQLSFGGSDELASGLGFKDDLNDLYAARPDAKAIGEGLGLALPAFASGGESLLARGLTAPMRGVAALGRAAEGAAASVVGKGATSLAGRVAQKAVASAAAAGTEGAFYQGGRAISESALGDQDLTAEKLVTEMGKGLVLGGAFGGALGAGVGAFSRGGGIKLGTARAADFEAVAGAHLGDEAAPGLGAALKRDAAASRPLDAAASGVTRFAEDADHARLLSDAWRKRETVFAKHNDTLEGATRAISRDIDEMLTAGRQVDMATFGESKANQMAKLVPEENVKAARAASVEAWADAKKTLGFLDELSAKGGGEGSVKRLSNWLDDFGRDMGKHDAATLFDKLDDFKRQVGKEAKFGKSPFGLSEAAQQFDDLYHRLRGNLETEGVWGKAAVAQREINAATTAMVDKGAKFSSKFTTQYGSEMGRPLHVANPESVGGFVRSLTSAKNDLSHQMITDRIAARRGFLDAVERNYALKPAVKAAVEKERGALGRIEATMKKTTEEVSFVNQVRAAQAAEQSAGIGGALGLVTDVMTRPLKTLERLAQIHRIASRVEARIESGVRGFLSGGGAKAPSRIEAAIPRAGSETRAKAFSRVSENIRELANNVPKLASRLAIALRDTADHAPGTSASASAKVTMGMQFLASKLPAERGDPYALQQHLVKPRPPSDLEMDTFENYLRAWMDPGSVLDEMKSGRMPTREAVETLQTQYPKLYARMGEMVTERLADPDRPELPYAKKLQLSILFDRPTDATTDPEFIRDMQGSDATGGGVGEQGPGGSSSPGAEVGPPRRALTIAKGFQTAAQRVEEN